MAVIVAFIGATILYGLATVPTQQYMIESICVATYNSMKDKPDCSIYTASSMRVCRSFCLKSANSDFELCQKLNSINGCDNGEDDEAWIITVTTCTVVLVTFLCFLQYEMWRRAELETESMKKSKRSV
jgi:hypothetical protein